MGRRLPGGGERVDRTAGRLGPAKAQDLLRQPATPIRLYGGPGGLQGTRGIGGGPLALPSTASGYVSGGSTAGGVESASGLAPPVRSPRPFPRVPHALVTGSTASSFA